MRLKMPPITVYTVLEFSSALFFSLIFTVNMIYQVTVVEMSPFQLVLTGTILEATVFIFEVPTGVIADVRSRRLSIILGYILMALGFILEGSLPLFWAVALSQVLWGVGYTFTSGATQAWIVDEVGDDQANKAFLRGSQAHKIGDLVAIPISIALGAVALNIPIVVGGVSMLILAAFLTLTMTEDGFSPTPPEDRSTWKMMAKTVRDARLLAARQPALLTLLGIGFFYGLYSEGLDRLWTPHLLEGFGHGWLDVIQPVIWLGAIRAASLGISFALTELVRRRLDMQRVAALARILLLTAGGIVISLAGFGLTRSFPAAVVLYWAIGALRGLHWPIYSIWYNRQIDDAQVRATMFSVSSQVDAVGQITGGPPVGAIGNLSVRWALVSSALLLSPVIPLYTTVIRRSREH